MPISFEDLAGKSDRSNKKKARKPTENQKRLLNSGLFKKDRAEEALDQQGRLRDQLVAAMARKRKKRG
jgi:hypothetical protein